MSLYIVDYENIGKLQQKHSLQTSASRVAFLIRTFRRNLDIKTHYKENVVHEFF